MVSTSNKGRHVCRGFSCVHWCTSCIQIPYLVRIVKLIWHIFPMDLAVTVQHVHRPFPAHGHPAVVPWVCEPGPGYTLILFNLIWPNHNPLVVRCQSFLNHPSLIVIMCHHIVSQGGHPGDNTLYRNQIWMEVTIHLSTHFLT